jgi:hypothetical protein
MCCGLLSKVVVYAFPKTHNLKVVGSNPTPATNQINKLDVFLERPYFDWVYLGYTLGVCFPTLHSYP